MRTRLVAHTANRRSPTLRSSPGTQRGGINKTVSSHNVSRTPDGESSLADEEEARNEETRLLAHTANRRSSKLRSGPEALRGGINKTVTLFIRTHPHCSVNPHTTGPPLAGGRNSRQRRSP